MVPRPPASLRRLVPLLVALGVASAVSVAEGAAPGVSRQARARHPAPGRADAPPPPARACRPFALPKGRDSLPVPRAC